jgi:hypothetical protein
MYVQPYKNSLEIIELPPLMVSVKSYKRKKVKKIYKRMFNLLSWRWRRLIGCQVEGLFNGEKKIHEIRDDDSIF